MRRMARAALLLLGGLSACTPAAPIGADSTRAGQARAALDLAIPALMERHHVPGLAVAIVDAEGTILIAGHGHTDASGSERVDGSTVFEAASLGKALFAHGILQAQADPPFDPDTPITDLLQAPVVNDPRGATITGRHLLSHTSGLAFSESEGRRHLAFPPGTQWQYSGLGFHVLQQTVETLWDTPIEPLMHRVLFGPLGMDATSYLPPRHATQAWASGHDRQGQPLPPSTWTTASASSSLHTSARDYGRFLSAVLAELRSHPDGQAARMLQPQVEVDGARRLHWGLGWAVAREPSDTVFLHWGSNPGFKSLAVGSLQQQTAMVVLTNGDNGLEIATALVPIVFGHAYPFLDFYMLHPDD